MITADQLKDVMERADALHRYLDIDKKKIEYEEESLRTQDPDFWSDSKAAEEQMKKVKGIKKWIDGYNDVRNTTPRPSRLSRNWNSRTCSDRKKTRWTAC